MAKYSDMPICDLRCLTDPDAVKQIESISDIATLLLPNDADPAVMSALAAIPMSDIGSILYLPAKAKLQTTNGVAEVHSAAGQEQYIMINGICLIRELPEDANVTVSVNGLCLIEQSLRGHKGLHFANSNGQVSYMDIGDYKIYPNNLTLESETIQYFSDGMLIVTANKLVFHKDVTVQQLQEKRLRFLAANKIIAPKRLIPYLTATATVLGKIEEAEE